MDRYAPFHLRGICWPRCSHLRTRAHLCRLATHQTFTSRWTGGVLRGLSHQQRLSCRCRPRRRALAFWGQEWCPSPLWRWTTFWTLSTPLKCSGLAVWRFAPSMWVLWEILSSEAKCLLRNALCRKVPHAVVRSSPWLRWPRGTGFVIRHRGLLTRTTFVFLGPRTVPEWTKGPYADILRAPCRACLSVASRLGIAYGGT